jgi:hypothetical protein
MSQPSDDTSGDDLMRALTGYFERQPEPDPENEALQLDIDAWMRAQKRPVRLRPEARGTSDSAGHRVAELVPPPVAAAPAPAPALSPAEEMRERALQRERRKRADRGKQLDPRTKSHPIDTSGEPRGAEVASPLATASQGDLHLQPDPDPRQPQP